jgi:glycosyltransferase involved in cell wall biosynthesis
MHKVQKVQRACLLNSKAMVLAHNHSPRQIAISLGNIGALHDGLGEFALQIGQRIAAQAERWREQHGLRFCFHLREKFIGLFGNDVTYLPVNRWQRLWHQQPQHISLWHSLHQVNKTLPPRGCDVRMVTVHDLNYLYAEQTFASRRQHQRCLAMLARTDQVVAISQHTASDVCTHLHWQGPLQVIYNGARSFVNAPREPLAGWAADDERPFLYHLSRMSPSKNPQVLINLARAWPEMIFVFCGPPSEEAKHLRATVQLPNVQFHLGINDAQKAWAFAHCTGFLFPSLAEGFGLPPLEAMQFGKPVFLSKLTSLPEVGGDAACYFDDWSPAAMRQVVEQGLQRGAEPVRIAEVKRHAARFDWDDAAQAYLALYLRLLNPAQEALAA